MTDERFEQIYKDTYNYVLKYIISNCANMQDVNDIIQDTYVGFYTSCKKGKKINLYDIAIIMLLILAIIIRWPSVLESFSLISHGLYQGIAFIVGIISCVIINMLNKFGYKSIILHVLIVILCVISTITFGGFGDSIYILVIYLFTMCKLKTQSE